jgi:hypothetical protein
MRNSKLQSSVHLWESLSRPSCTFASRPRRRWYGYSEKSYQHGRICKFERTYTPHIIHLCCTKLSTGSGCLAYSMNLFRAWSQSSKYSAEVIDMAAIYVSIKTGRFGRSVGSFLNLPAQFYTRRFGLVYPVNTREWHKGPAMNRGFDAQSAIAHLE